MRTAILVATGVTLAIGVGAAARPQDDFDHEQHARLFPTCSTCHVSGPGDEPVIPAAVSCNACHDGEVEERVDWSRTPPPPDLIRFSHAEHVEAAASDSAACTDCHGGSADVPAVSRYDIESCAACHDDLSDHPGGEANCATCHTTLAESDLSRDQVAMLPAPAGHSETDFALNHADENTSTVACATCHSQDFCIQCHVNAPENRVIQTLAMDSRGTAIEAAIPTPATHEDHDFQFRHGGLAETTLATCSSCHTSNSCAACHQGGAEIVDELPVAGPRRGPGAIIARAMPESHTAGFVSGAHATAAGSSPQTCAGCHVRTECIDCHQPDAAASGSYHEAGFVSLHSVEAYRRPTSCSDCHSVGGFCQECHVSAGLTSDGQLDAGYHDAKFAFAAAHEPAARQSLESCVSCHTETDCLQCHSALGGRRFSPHGPGFDPGKLRSKNFEMCAACHGPAVPNTN